MISANTTDRLSKKRRALTAVRTDLSPAAVKDISGAMNATLADVFALYLKTKNFHWRMSGPHFRDYHTMSKRFQTVDFRGWTPLHTVRIFVV